MGFFTGRSDKKEVIIKQEKGASWEKNLKAYQQKVKKLSGEIELLEISKSEASAQLSVLEEAYAQRVKELDRKYDERVASLSAQLHEVKLQLEQVSEDLSKKLKERDSVELDYSARFEILKQKMEEVLIREGLAKKGLKDVDVREVELLKDKEAFKKEREAWDLHVSEEKARLSAWDKAQEKKRREMEELTASCALQVQRAESTKAEAEKASAELNAKIEALKIAETEKSEFVSAKQGAADALKDLNNKQKTIDDEAQRLRIWAKALSNQEADLKNRDRILKAAEKQLIKEN